MYQEPIESPILALFADAMIEGSEPSSHYSGEKQTNNNC